MRANGAFRSTIVFALLLFFMAGLMTESAVYADGKYFPAQYYKRAPDMPSQRAIIVYRQGAEKLVIESALEGEGTEFGWLLPVPSEPTEIKAVSRGMLESLSLTLQPEIVSRPMFDIGASFIWLLVVVVLSLTYILSQEFRTTLYILVLIIAAFLVAFFFGSHLGVTIEAAGDLVADIQDIGSYQIVTLKADDANDLNEWLTTNGYAGLSSKEAGIISDYIAAKWHFIAAKLKRDGSGLSKPHPVAVTFESEQCIYPMRLTSAVGNDVYVELFVVASNPAACPQLTLDVADRYEFDLILPGASLKTDEGLPAYAGRSFGQNIGHPDANDYLWEGCFVSKLCDVMNPQQMNKDIIINFDKPNAKRKMYFTQVAAIEIALGTGINLTWVAVFVLAFIGKKKVGQTGRIKTLAKVFIPAVVILMVTPAVVGLLLPKIRLTGIKKRDIRTEIHFRRELYEAVEQFGDKLEESGIVKKAEAENLLAEYFKSSNMRNTYTGEQIRQEDSPGNYMVAEDERGILFRFYDSAGFPHDWEIKPDIERSSQGGD